MMELPPGLRAALDRESTPVRPNLPAGFRAAFVVAVACITAIVYLAIEGLRANAGTIGWMPMWAPAALRVLAACWLLALAFRNAVPGMRSPSTLRGLAVAGAPALLAALAEYLAHASHVATVVHGQLGCYRRELALALPAGLVLAWLLARSHALHPVFVAIAGTLGVGLLADAALHLSCPATNLSHTILVHGGAVLTLVTASAAVGYLASLKSARRL